MSAFPRKKTRGDVRAFRARQRKKRGEGLGLGLSLVQRICENQGWNVSLTNMEPNGCRFQVELSLSRI